MRSSTHPNSKTENWINRVVFIATICGDGIQSTYYFCLFMFITTPFVYAVLPSSSIHWNSSIGWINTASPQHRLWICPHFHYDSDIWQQPSEWDHLCFGLTDVSGQIARGIPKTILFDKKHYITHLDVSVALKPFWLIHKF